MQGNNNDEIPDTSLKENNIDLECNIIVPMKSRSSVTLLHKVSTLLEAKLKLEERAGKWTFQSVMRMTHFLYTLHPFDL
jgi:hypothetical protein